MKGGINLIELIEGRLIGNEYKIQPNQEELIIEADDTSEYYVLIVNNSIRYILSKEDGKLIWNMPRIIDNEIIRIKIESKRLGTDDIIFLTNEIIIQIPDYEQNFEIYEDMIDQHSLIPIKNRNIIMPTNYKIVVAKDNASQLLTFDIDRFFDGMDLSKMAIGIKYINAIGESNKSIAVNVNKTDSRLRFGWLLNNDIAIKDGIVRFAIEFLTTNEKDELYVWQTVESQFHVEKDLYVDDGYIEDLYPSIIQEIQIKLKNIENRVIILEERSEGTINHAELENLNYENSGHTGFVSINDLNNHKNDLIIHITAGEREKLILFKGFFPNSSLLIATYPLPTDGSYAIVGIGESSTVWAALGGIWSDTGSSGTVTIADLMGEVANREAAVGRIDNDILNLTNNLDIHKNDSSKHKTATDQIKIDNLPNNTNESLTLKADKNNVLTLNNTIPFTPQADYEPATRKFVLDNAAIVEDLNPASLISDDENNALIVGTDKKLFVSIKGDVQTVNNISPVDGNIYLNTNDIPATTTNSYVTEDLLMTINELDVDIDTIQTNIEILQNKITNKVDKVEGKSLISDDEVLRLANVDNFDNSLNNARISTLETILPQKANKNNVLELDNITPFTPTNNYHPTTKEYVDNKILSGGVTIVDNLNGASAVEALSANQGRILNETKADKSDIKAMTKLLFLGLDNNTPIMTKEYPTQNSIILPTTWFGANPNTWTEILRINAGSDIADIEMQFIPGNHFSTKLWFVSEMQQNNVQVRVQLINIDDGAILASATSKTNLLSDGITPIPVSFDNVHQILKDLPLSKVRIVISIMPLLFGVQIGIISNIPDEISFVNIASTTGANMTDIDELESKLDSHIDDNEKHKTIIEQSKIDNLPDNTNSDMSRVELIAKGASRALVFNTLLQLDNWINGLYIRPDGKSVEDLQIGDNLFVIERDVPDFWWDGTQKQELETGKVDLTDYPKTTEVQAMIANHANNTELHITNIERTKWNNILDLETKIDEINTTLVTKASITSLNSHINDDIKHKTPIEQSKINNLPDNTSAKLLEIESNIDGLAPLESPNFTGVATAPTAPLGTNTNQLATTAFVLANAGTSGGTSNIIVETFTLPMISWITSTTYSNFKYQADIILSELTVNDFVNVVFDVQSTIIANNAGILSSGDIFNGYIRLYSKSIPDSILNGTLIVVKDGA